MKKILILILALVIVLTPSYCFSAKVFRHNKRKIKVEAIKRGDFYNNIIRLKINVKGGQSCKKGQISVNVKGLGQYIVKRIKVVNYPSYHFFQSRITAPKSQRYGKIEIISATFDCYR